MLAYTTYSEAGGVGKTTSAANLAVAHARAGLKPLVIPLDQQEGNLSHLLNVDQNRDKDIDTLAHHLIDRPKGDFEDLIVEAEHGVHIIPEHNNLGQLNDWLQTQKQQAEQIGEAFGTKSALLSVLKKNNVRETYDVIICDPPATEGPHLHNALNATRSLVLPIELSSKGEASVKGLEDLVDGLSEMLNINVGVLAAIPIGFSGTNDEKAVLEAIEYPVPEVIRNRKSLMGGSWTEQCSAYTYVRDHRDRQRDHEMDTLANFDRIARFIEQQAGIEAPNPPGPGTVEQPAEV